MERELKIGMHIIFIDSLRQRRDALVTAVFTPSGPSACCNVVLINKDERALDEYGRQTERFTSVCHKSCQGEVVYGNVFAWPDEEELK